MYGVRCTVQFNPLFNCTFIKGIHTVQQSGLNSARTRYKKPVSRPNMKGGGALINSISLNALST
jgi:hypothetical protein